jgi:hypothetical protein
MLPSSSCRIEAARMFRTPCVCCVQPTAYRRAYIAADAHAWAAGSADHHRIYEAAERGDAVGAGDATAEHLARTALTVLADAAPDHDPGLVRGALRSSLAGTT